MKNLKSQSKQLRWCKKISADFISLHNCREHNLKSVDVDIPRHSLTVVTGVSGSGKSSLVFDTLYREGERRYLESFSSYARQYLGKLTRPDVGHIDGLSPTIAVDQKRVVRNPRSTVGTLSEIYDYLRLLFARLGKIPKGASQGFPKLERALFSFNSPAGACPHCKGLGVQDRVDDELLIEDPVKTLRQGALVITTPTGYTIYSQVTIDVLNRVCEAHGFSVDIPWQELTAEQKKVVLYGSDIIKIPYGKHPLESRMKWSGITAKPREEGYYKGIIPVIENILKVDRNKNILRFARSMPCTSCKGTRLNPDALAITIDGKHIAQFAALTIRQLQTFFLQLQMPDSQAAIGEPIITTILGRCQLLIDLGLGYLTLDRESTTLSGGEAQRIRLATQMSTGLRGILYTLDEPSIGLHHSDNQRLLDLLKQLRDNGNTVVLVEHDEETMLQADRLIDIGPAAGKKGGEILFNGTPQELLKEDVLQDFPAAGRSRTRAFLTGKETIATPTHRRQGNGNMLTVTGATQNNLKNISVSFKLATLNVVTGVSGAGKSSLVHDILANQLKRQLHQANTQPGKFESITGIEYIDKVIEIDQSPIGRTPRSNPATYTKVFDHIRDLFAQVPQAKARKWSKGRFSFNVKGGRCEGCEGAGIKQIGMHFLGNVDVLCDQCSGKRFNDDTLEIQYLGKTIYDILEMPIQEALVFFHQYPKITRVLQAMTHLGLGYIQLGQSATTLSGGEAQRVKLAAELCRPATGKTLYILDEPTTGLHAADIMILLASLQRLVEKGNTVITVEHHQDFIKTADWVIDLGPGSGEEGGQCIASGTPEEVASIPAKPRLPHDLPVTRRIQQNDPIIFKGVTTHNLKAVDVTIPVNKITVITGVSGSGKSSLAFDTIFAEGQQRFLERFSTYSRRLLANSAGTDREMASCSGLMPAIAVSQASASHNPRSTVGTMTEILDYYRLLFARVGVPHCPACGNKLTQNKCLACNFSAQHPLLTSMFSFNHHQGACNHCKGLGVVTVCDPDKLVTHSDRSLLDGALDGSKTGKFYGDPHGQYIATLWALSRAKGIDFSKPWCKLDANTRHIAMYGNGDETYDVTWKYKRKNRNGEHNFQAQWLGFVNYVNQEYQRKHADKRGTAMMPLMIQRPCPACAGHRLKGEFLAVRFAGLNIAQLCHKTATQAMEFFEQVADTPASFAIGTQDFETTRQLRLEILRRLGYLRDVGLDYLSLDRSADTLSGGEAQRIRLAGQLGSGLTGVIYVLDEPTIGLHSRDTQKLLSVLTQLKEHGNTVIIVEHDAEIIAAADHIIDLGPGGGKNGGQITAIGSPDEIKNNKHSKTGRYLNNPNALPVPIKRRTLATGLKITQAIANNLKQIDVAIPAQGIVAVTGVSGCGKSSLLFDVISASYEKGGPVACKAISGFENFNHIVAVNQNAVGSSPSSTPATYTGIFDIIRQLFSDTPEAQTLKYKKNRFSFNVKGGRCETCQGMGKIRTPMDFLADVWTTCNDCNGQRYNQETLQIKLAGQSISDILKMTVSEAHVFYSTTIDHGTISHVLSIMEEVGLGYIQLGQAGNTLSGGEAQRLKLVTQLIKAKNDKNLYLLDEPTTGLHFEDVGRLLTLFHRLADAGHTLLVIEHHPDVIKHADWVIELGPGGGDKGGKLEYDGMPPAGRFL
jgi:excinuclease ABC subunit A